jgi:hypothetical protein
MALLVQVLSFGSVWWVRPGWNEEDPEHYTQNAAYFNTSGIQQGRRLYPSGHVRGLVLFNVSSGLDPHRTHDNIGRIFSFREVERYRETNRLLAIRRMPKDVTPTHLLVAMNSVLHGAISRRGQWRIGSVQVIAMSRYRGKEETLLLLAAGACVQTTVGVWTVTQGKERSQQLTLLGELDVATVGR